HLTWLWQGEPPKSESASNTFNKVKPIRKILNNYTQMKELSLLYTSGIEKFATGAWEFFVSGRSQWQAQKKNYQSTLTFSMPIEWVGENSKAFIDLFIKCAQRLKAKHGYAGYACIISQIRSDKNEPTEAFMARKAWAMDVGDPMLLARDLIEGIKTVSWLTAINYEWFNSIKEEEALNSELPMNWFIGYDYGTGIVIQAGALPLMGSVESDPLPAPYVLLNRVLKPLRVEKIGDLHRGNYSTDEIPLIKGYLANH
ncbi:type VI immunity family protein, partial [Acinetobacter sp. TGL-Y2]|uniref:type VI immunity family protein n=2 Tax=Acinetobacter TaxID=469 RepID=UPI0019065B5C